MWYFLSNWSGNANRLKALSNTVNAFRSEWHFLTEMINKT